MILCCNIGTLLVAHMLVFNLTLCKVQGTKINSVSQKYTHLKKIILKAAFYVV